MVPSNLPVDGTNQISARYKNSAASHAYADFHALKRAIQGVGSESEVPIFAEHELASADQLVIADWPKRATILGRGVLAILCRLGAFDFATGQQLSGDNIAERHYHHLFPDALLKQAGIHSFLALNCALIVGKTNMSIGRKDPLEYIKDRYDWTSKSIVAERLQSHLIPVEELATGGYEGLSDDERDTKLASDFEAFLRRRAELVLATVDRLVEGRQVHFADLAGSSPL